MLRPEGYLLCTVLGSSFVHQMLTAQDQAKLAQTGALTLDSNHPRASYSTQVLRSWDVFQTRDRVREAFGAVCRICDYTNVTVGQDMLVLRRDSVDQMRTQDRKLRQPDVRITLCPARGRNSVRLGARGLIRPLFAGSTPGGSRQTHAAPSLGQYFCICIGPE